MLLFLILTVGIFFASRWVVREIYILLRRFTDNNGLIFSIIAVLFLPGTIVHEAAHFVTALILLLPVKSMVIFPEFEGGEIRLGKVTYERRDFIRGVLVGIAPFFVGTGLLFFMLSSNIFFDLNLGLKALFLYLVFSVSSNMFSSKTDLRDLALIVPVIIFAAIILYVLGVDVNIVLSKRDFWAVFNDIIIKINNYFVYVLLINLGLFALIKTVNKLLPK